MDNSLEDDLYQAVRHKDPEAVSQLLIKGANPNKTVGRGKTCLCEAAYIGHIGIVQLLIDASKTHHVSKLYVASRKRPMRSHKRKLRHEGRQEDTVVKCKNMERSYDGYKVHCESIGTTGQSTKPDRNQGYFVFIHSEGSSSDEGRISSLRSPLSPQSLTPSPQADLEWDEEIGNVAPTTSEDETWSSMYKWYASILECTGAAIASASGMTYGIDQQDAYMKTALHYAALQGHAGVVKLLLEAGCKIDLTAGDGLTPLHVAVIRNHAQVVEMLIVAGSNVNYKTHEKMTPLHFAASRGYLNLVKILVNNGAYLEARDTNERTALYLAAGRGHVDVVKFLISSGTNVNIEEIHGYTPLCEAVWQRYAPVVQVLLQSGARITHSYKLLHFAIIQRQVDIVKLLVSVGGSVNLHNDNGDTPLILASRLSQPAVARLLLENGANVNSCNSITGASALHMAVEDVNCPKNFEQVLICLIEYNIDINAISLSGDTALNRALYLQRDHAAVLLIRYGADVNAHDFQMSELDNLALACRRHCYLLATMLLKAGHCATLSDRSKHFPFCGKPECLRNWLFNACRHPLSLSDLCRIKIRHLFRDRILFREIESLPLPKSLKRYLMMEDFSIEEL